MKNKKINHSSIILLSCCLCMVVAKEASKLKIFRNVDGSLVEVPSKVELLTGTNFTLICRIDNNKRKDSFNGYVAWFTPMKKPFKFNLNDLRKSSNLELNNVSVTDKGFYVCFSMKSKIFKSVYLVVKKPIEIHEPNDLKALIRKRDIVYGDNSYDFNFNFTNTQEWEEYQKTIKKITEEYDLSNFNGNNNYGNNDIYQSNNNYDLTYVNPNPPNNVDNSFPGKSIALIFGVFFVVFVIWVIIRYFGSPDENETDNRNNRQQNGSSNPRINVNRYRDDTLRTDPELFDALEIHRPLTFNTSIDSTELDLPPTYLSSTHNSTQNLHGSTDTVGVGQLNDVDNNKFILPPSYDEAVGHAHDNHNVCSANSNINQHYSGNDHVASVDTSSECNNEGGGDSGVGDSGTGGDSGGGDSGGGGDCGGGNSGGGGDCGGGGSDD